MTRPRNRRRTVRVMLLVVLVASIAGFAGGSHRAFGDTPPDTNPSDTTVSTDTTIPSDTTSSVDTTTTTTPPLPTSITCNTPSGHCNVLLIETDDQSIDTMFDPNTMQLRSSYMPLLNAQISSEPGWYTFTQARAQDPLCGPSRWSQLTGMTSVHHRMTCNQIKQACATKGEPSYRADRDKSYVEALKNAGYWNSWIGKYLNWYPCAGFDTNANKTFKIPAGLNDWHVTVADQVLYNGNYNLIESNTGTSGVKVNYPKATDDSTYGTYVIRDKEMSAIDRCAATTQPCFFAWMPNAPHQPGTLPHDYNKKAVKPVPNHYPSYNEGCGGATDPDISDKPSFEIANITCYTGTTWTRNKWQGSLQAVDTSLAAIFQHLKDTGLYDNTVIIYTSDHAFSDNENNHVTKEVPYDTDTRVPFFMRVPGFPGATVPSLVYLPDLAPTLYDIAGATPLVPADGVSLVPLITGAATSVHPDGVLGDHLVLQTGVIDTEPWYALYQDCSIHTDRCFVIIKYQDGEYELYDLISDPYEMHNLVPNPVTGYAGVPGFDDSNPVVTDLKAQLDARIAAGV